MLQLWVGEDAAASAAVEGVAPERLDGEGAGAQGNVGRCPLARADPGAFVAILAAAAVNPASTGVDVGFGFRELVASHDRDSIGDTSRATVHEVGTATGAGIRDIRHVGIRNIAVARTR